MFIYQIMVFIKHSPAHNTVAHNRMTTVTTKNWSSRLMVRLSRPGQCVQTNKKKRLPAVIVSDFDSLISRTHYWTVKANIQTAFTQFFMIKNYSAVP